MRWKLPNGISSRRWCARTRFFFSFVVVCIIIIGQHQRSRPRTLTICYCLHSIIRTQKKKKKRSIFVCCVLCVCVVTFNIIDAVNDCGQRNQIEWNFWSQCKYFFFFFSFLRSFFIFFLFFRFSLVFFFFFMSMWNLTCTHTHTTHLKIDRKKRVANGMKWNER